MIVADLHVHTTQSDGSLTLAEIPAAAERAGLDAVAVTDHDRIHPELPDPVVDREGVTVIHGIELKVETDTQRIDLLGYGLRRTPALTALVDRLQENRLERAAEIIRRVEDRTGVALDVPLEPGVGRPHVARAIERSGAPYDYQAAFDELIGDGGPCFVARELPSFAQGRERLAEACAVVGLAHPFRYDDPGAALDLVRDLDAVEIPYPYDRAVDTTPAVEAAERHDLLVTGGSDAHDDRLGRAGLDRGQLSSFRTALDQ